MDLGLDGKVVFLTGGSGGIGRAVARAFAAEGARVAAFSLEDGEGGDGVASFTGDVRDPAAVRAAMDAAVARWGRVDVCVPCAGIWPGADVPLHEQPEDRVRAVIDVNVLGVVWAARAFLQALARTGPRADGHGAGLVLVGSTAGRFGEPWHAEYAASKAALAGLMRSLKNEIVQIDPRGRVNMVEPGWTLTPMTAGAMADRDAVRAATRTMPLRQLGMPEDVAHAVLFLASPVAARHVSGDALAVAGGMEGRVLW
jgi:3-oxoacyl-[acyl-carrier protein] reductase